MQTVAAAPTTTAPAPAPHAKTEKQLRIEFLKKEFANIWSGYKAEPNEENKKIAIDAVKANLGKTTYWMLKKDNRIVFGVLNNSGFTGYCFTAELKTEFQNKIPLILEKNWGKLIGFCEVPKQETILKSCFNGYTIDEIDESTFEVHKVDFILSQGEIKMSSLVRDIKSYPLTAALIIKDAKKQNIDISHRAMSEIQKQKETELREIGRNYELNNRQKSKFVKSEISKVIKTSRKLSK